jgi:hypothetical protein
MSDDRGLHDRRAKIVISRKRANLSTSTRTFTSGATGTRRIIELFID